jgi:TonB-linked SusC/RagA family outer membrane protein
MLFACLQVGARGVAQKVTLNENKSSLEKVLKKIEYQTGFTFLYENKVLEKASPVTLHVAGASLEEVLSLCFKGQPLTYKIFQHTVVIKGKVIQDAVKAQVAFVPVANIVTGKVTNSKSEPLVGVSVTVKGTNVGTTTNGSGNYSIEVPGDGTLIFSNVGFGTREIQVNGRSSINLSLEESISALDQVVVVGYGSQKKKDLTGAVATLSADEVKDLGVTQIDQALSGKMAGVQVLATTGAPGESVKIRIRGVGSISAGSDPLYVVDGFPTDDIQMINPNDIETIDVLKDASATAIYGSRGSNGVIFITTKRGKQGKSIISLNAYSGWQKILKTPKFLSVTDQAKYYYEGVKNQNLDAGKDVSGDPLTWGVPKTIMDILEGRNTTNSDAYDAIFQTAPQQNYNLSARGGNESVKYAISGEYLNQDGIVISTNFKRYSLRTNLDAQVSKNLLVKLNFNTAYTTNNFQITSGGSGGDDGIIGAASTWQHWYPLYNEDGSYFSGFGTDASNNVRNPIAIAKEEKNGIQGSRSLGNLSTEYQISDALKFNVMLGATVSNSHTLNFIPNIPVFNTVADGTDARSDYLNWLTETTLNYKKNFKKHNVAALFGYTTQRQSSKENFLESRSFPNNLVYTLNAASNIIYQGSSSESEWAMVSYLSRINYSYDNKYYITASIRADGSSRFGADKKYGVFPSAALAWRISEEGFLKDVSFINDIKIRASYGATGNNNIGNYAQYATASYESYTFGGEAVGGYAPSQFANSNLTWEKQESINTGIDATFFNNRISFNIDYFQTKNYSLLLNVNVPLITGFGTALQNIGEIHNKGWEFVLNTKNLVGKLKWSTSLNVATYHNKVTKLGPEGAPIINSFNITQIGQPIGMFYGYVADGVFMNEAELDAGPIYSPGLSDHSRVGDIRFVDISGPDGKPDGIINSYDRTIIGSPYPDFYYGMTNNFSYKNIDLSFTLQGSHGNKIFEASDAFLYTRARYKQLDIVKNYWESEAQPGDGVSPRPNNNPTGGLRQKSTRFLDNGAFFRINNINLSYSFTEKIANKLSLSSLRAYITATNPLLITKYNFFNPEVSDNSNALTPGVSNYNYPVAKRLIVGLSVSF